MEYSPSLTPVCTLLVGGIATVLLGVGGFLPGCATAPAPKPQSEVFYTQTTTLANWTIRRYQDNLQELAPEARKNVSNPYTYRETVGLSGGRSAAITFTDADHDGVPSEKDTLEVRTELATENPGVRVSVLFRDCGLRGLSEAPARPRGSCFEPDEGSYEGTDASTGQRFVLSVPTIDVRVIQKMDELYETALAELVAYAALNPQRPHVSMELTESVLGQVGEQGARMAELIKRTTRCQENLGAKAYSYESLKCLVDRYGSGGDFKTLIHLQHPKDADVNFDLPAHGTVRKVAVGYNTLHALASVSLTDVAVTGKQRVRRTYFLHKDGTSSYEEERARWESLGDWRPTEKFTVDEKGSIIRYKANKRGDLEPQNPQKASKDLKRTIKGQRDEVGSVIFGAPEIAEKESGLQELVRQDQVGCLEDLAGTDMNSEQRICLLKRYGTWGSGEAQHTGANTRYTFYGNEALRSFSFKPEAQPPQPSGRGTFVTLDVPTQTLFLTDIMSTGKNVTTRMYEIDPSGQVFKYEEVVYKRMKTGKDEAGDPREAYAPVRSTWLTKAGSVGTAKRMKKGNMKIGKPKFITPGFQRRLNGQAQEAFWTGLTSLREKDEEKDVVY